jgi:hypothetical protein
MFKPKTFLPALVLSLQVQGCASESLGEAPDIGSSEETAEVSVQRIAVLSNGETEVKQEARVSRAELLNAVARRQALEELARETPPGTSASGIELKSGVTHCNVAGLAPGAACFPCEVTDLWLYDGKNLQGNKMICLMPFNAAEGGLWFTRYFLRDFVCDNIEGVSWSHCARSAWAPVNARVAIGCSQGLARIIPPDQILNDLDCVFPNSSGSNEVITGVQWLKP